MRSKAAVKNFSAYILSFSFNAVMTLLASPILLSGLGDINFGIWKTLQKLFDIASVADGRSGQTLKMLVARAHDDGVKNRAVGAAALIWIIYLPIAMLCMGIFYYCLPIFIGSDSTTVSRSVILLFIFFALNFLIAPLVTIPDAVLMGSNFGYKSIWIQVSGMIVTSLLSIYIVKTGWGLEGVGFATFFSGLIVALMMTWITKRVSPWFSLEKPTRSDVMQQLSTTLQMNAWLLVEKLLLGSEVVIISSLLGAKVATSFSFMSYTPQLALVMLLIIASSLTPGIAGMLKEDLNKARTIIIASRSFIHALAFAIAIIYIFANEIFVQLWVGKEILPPDYSNLAIGLSLLVTGIIRCEAQLQDLNLAVGKRVIHGIIGCIISIFAAYTLNKLSFGRMDIVIVGALIGKIYISIAYINITSGLHNIAIDYKRKVAPLLLIVAISYAYTFKILEPSDVMKVFLGFLVALIAFFTVLSGDAYLFIKSRLNKK